MEVVKIEAKYKSKDIPWDNPHLPAPPLRLLINAQSNSGKTNLIVNLITRDDMYGKYFAPDHIHVFSRSILHDEIWDTVDEKTWEVSDSKFNKDALQRIYSKQAKQVEKEGKTKENARLVIADDVISEVATFGGKQTLLEVLAMRGRHINISFIVVSQRYTLIPRTLRINKTGLIIFRIHNVSEGETIYKENGSFLSRKQFQTMTRDIWGRSPFEFLFIDTTKPMKEQFRIGFKESYNVQAFDVSSKKSKKSNKGDDDDDVTQKSKRVKTEDYI